MLVLGLLGRKFAVCIENDKQLVIFPTSLCNFTHHLPHLAGRESKLRNITSVWIQNEVHSSQIPRFNKLNGTILRAK
jgi:hypothetical protein